MRILFLQRKNGEALSVSAGGMDEYGVSDVFVAGDYYILNCTNIPSVIAECGFLSNEQDEALLITEEYQNELAYTIFKGIVGYLAQMSFNFFN